MKNIQCTGCGEKVDIPLEKYNGWTNYATWRVNLEMFDGFDISDYFGDVEERDDPQYISDAIKAHAEDMVSFDTSGNSFVLSYALAFMSDVNWYEIAEHLIDEVKA